MVNHNNLGKNKHNNSCLDVEIVEVCKIPVAVNLNNKSNLNINNINNLNNLTNINNINNTSILTNPETKTEIIYYFLYDKGEQTGATLVKEANLSSIDSFNTLRNRNKNRIIISKKIGTTNYYNISNELRESISLKIKQKLRQIENKKQLEKDRHQQEQTTEERFESIQKIIQNKSLVSFENGFYYIDLKELQELEPEIFGLFLENPETTIRSINTSLDKCGFKSPIRFKNFVNCIESISIDHIRVKNTDKVLLIECRSSILTDVRPQVINIKFECPSCGSIISVFQIGKKIKEPSRCSCGRRGGFKEISRDMIDRARFEVEDLTDLTESPQIKSITGFVKEHLTESKELSKINPGNEIKLLAILKTAEQNYAGGVSTALDLFLEVLEIEPFEVNIDLSSFPEDEIEKYKQISKTIQEDNNLNELRGSFAPEIIGNNKPKDMLLIKAGQGRTRKNNGNVLFVSNPGTAKSIMVKKYHSIVPGSSYISAGTASAVGLTATVEKKEEGWTLKPGVLVTTKQDAIIDEFNLLPEEDRPKLQEAMSEGQVTINKASIHAKLKVQCGIIACANPIGGVFNNTFNLVKQFNLPPQILNRFDAIFIIKDSITKQNDEAIAKQMLLRENNQITQKYSDEELKRFFLFIRNQKEPSFNKNLIENYIPKKYSDIRNSMRLGNSNKLINPRFIEAIIRISKSMAKIKMSSFVGEKDVDFAVDLLKNTYLDWEVIE